MSALKNAIERRGRQFAPSVDLSVVRRDKIQNLMDTRVENTYERCMELRLSTVTVCTDSEYRAHVRIIMARTLLRALYGDIQAQLSEIATAVSSCDRYEALRLIAELQNDIDDVEDLPTETEARR